VGLLTAVEVAEATRRPSRLHIVLPHVGPTYISFPRVLKEQSHEINVFKRLISATVSRFKIAAWGPLKRVARRNFRINTQVIFMKASNMFTLNYRNKKHKVAK
jgi:hypothetical protein